MQALAPYEPSAQLDKLADRPLMLWHGGQDERVPFAESERLAAELAEKGLAKNLRFVAEPQATHKISVRAAEAGVAFMAEML